MRSAIMELTGLDKVGDYTLLDNNGVQHITNRHAGGDGSADATMKNSADVARAAYVLNNFDNAYLAKDRAKGCKGSRGKRVPIVMFEKNRRHPHHCGSRHGYQKEHELHRVGVFIEKRSRRKKK